MSSEVYKEEKDTIAEDSDASTVSMGDEKSNASSYFDNSNIDLHENSFIISDIDERELLSSNVAIEDEIAGAIEAQEQKKVNVLDIFNKFKPTKIRRELTEDEVERHVDIFQTAEAPVEPTVKYGLTAKDILTGKKIVKSNESEEVFETIDVHSQHEKIPQNTSRSGVTARDILTGFRPAKAKTREEDLVPIQVISEEETSPNEAEVKVKYGITARDILNGRQGVKVKSSSKPEDVEAIEILSSEEESAIHSDKISKKKKSKKSSKPKPSSSNESFLITLKYKSRRDRIADLESKIRNSMASTVSAKDLFKKLENKRELNVTLKVNPETLQNFKSVDNSFFTKGSSHIPGAKSFLDMLSYKPVVAKNPIYKLKELPAPSPTLEQLHVTYDSAPIQHRTITLKKKERLTEPVNINDSSIKRVAENGITQIRSNHDITLKDDYDLLSIAKTQVPTVVSDPRYSKFLGLLKFPERLDNTSNDLWTSFYKPRISSEVLLDSRKTQDIRLWLENSFKILKRRTKRPNLKKLKRAETNEFDDFIDDDYDNETEEESYTPIMILSGPEGVGKSTVVYSLVEDLSGYVYEINASQSRGRKDIMANLKELSTTQLVHQNQDTAINQFQKGVILFEDVDVLFESDKGFWSVMEHVLSISRRPIILTCTDISAIPSNIIDCAVEEHSLYEIPRQPIEVLTQYLFLMALTKKVEVDEQVLKELIISNCYDLRKCISSLQVLCEVGIPPGYLVHINGVRKEQPPSVNDQVDLKKLVKEVDTLSMSDLFETNAKSLINHDILENEVLTNDTFINENELSVQPLPFEFNLGREIRDLLPQYPYENFKNDIKAIKKLDELFLKSRLKESRRITRQSAMTMFDFDENMGSKNIFTLPPSTYITDVCPFFRAFSREEAKTDHYNGTVIAANQDQSIDELMRAGMLKNKRFTAQNDILLYGPLRYWNI